MTEPTFAGVNKNLDLISIKRYEVYIRIIICDDVKYNFKVSGATGKEHGLRRSLSFVGIGHVDMNHISPITIDNRHPAYIAIDTVMADR